MLSRLREINVRGVVDDLSHFITPHAVLASQIERPEYWTRSPFGGTEVYIVQLKCQVDSVSVAAALSSFLDRFAPVPSSFSGGRGCSA